MSKCSVCGSRKGKRKCAPANGLVCSQCCGQTRRRECCEGCAHFREVRSAGRYLDIPRFSLQDMDSDMEMQSYAHTIEATLCMWDLHHECRLTDPSAMSVMEMLLDKYYFGDSTVWRGEALLRQGFKLVVQAIEQDLYDVPDDTIARILAVIYFTARRRTEGQREYLEFIHRYVGWRAGPGTRVLALPVV